MAKRYYELHVAGCTRQLTIMNISDTLAIASFVILGDTEIVTRTAEELARNARGDGYHPHRRNEGHPARP